MLRQVFTPIEGKNAIPEINIPREWYGQEVEIIIFPVSHKENNNLESKESKLLKLCGSWKSKKTAEEIISNIYGSRSSGKTRIAD